MRKALLTSSEVSALVSICVVVLFTLALFFSGYSLQQRTLQDLRVAIRPDYTRPSPKAHLPGYFRRETTTLPDGTVVVGQSQADVEEEERLAKKYELRASTAPSDKSGESHPGGEQVTATRQPEGDGEKAAAREPEREPESSRGKATEEQLRILSSLTAHAAKQAWGVRHPDPLAKNPLPITKAERRRLIKEEIQRLAQVDRPVYYQRRLW
ncbi:hypothetical protein E4U42_005497 [Claviceps africana]|uniref:Uncharacterized protein n=1 Tax=Claviceps africana TaxID=83212 RepID=A0A8K0J4N3_9HYPO|nr:hypothetical protein E4U42_005497 [Claviceps africana]